MTQTISELDPVLLDEAMQEILGSQYFRSSAQCSSLFRYIVENTLQGNDQCLRERVIGSEVFDRAPDYDTGNDHIVRSRASEVRKRLAQFYLERGSTATIRIGIPSGSYRATFEPVQRQPAAAPAVPSSLADQALTASDLLAIPFPDATTDSTSADPATETSAVPHPSSTHVRTLTRWAVAVCLLLAVVAATLWLVSRGQVGQSTFDTFWNPLIKAPKPALIYCGGAFVYKLSDPFLDEYKRSHKLNDPRREFFVDLKHGDSIDAAELLPDKNYVPFGDLASTARIVATLTRSNKAYDLRYGNDLAFTEFRTSPVILIGGLNNMWALRVTRKLRYTLEQDDHIVDQWHKEKVWTQTVDPENSARDDYAIISRINESDSGKFVLSIAGIRMYGTRAATDLVCDPTQLEHILATAPKGWEQKNMQIIIHTRILNDIPVSVNVEAIHVW